MKIWTNVKTFYAYSSKPLNNKVKEFQIMLYFCPQLILEFYVNIKEGDLISIDLFNLIKLDILNTKEIDHAGFSICLMLFGLEIAFSKYDTRHWDYDNNKWEE